MKRFSYVVILIFSISSSFGQIPSGNIIPTELLSNYEQDVYEVAVKYLHESGSPFASQIDIPQNIVNNVWIAMASVYNAFPIPERDSIFDYYCVHSYPEHLYEGTKSLTISCHSSVFYGNWQNYNPFTTIWAFDSLILAHQIYIDDVWIASFSPTLMMVTFQSTHFINIGALVNEFTSILGGNASIYQIMSNIWWFGQPQNAIYYDEIQGNKLLNFELRWGDCPSGCTEYKNYYFSIDSNNAVTYNGFTINATSSYEPWYNCNISVIPQYLIDTISFCDSMLYHSQWIKDTTMVLDTILNPNGGYSMIYSVLEPIGITNPVFTYETICSGDYYVFNNDTILASGLYTDTIQSTFSCDTVIYLFLSVSPPYENYYNIDICEGESIVLGTDTLTYQGIYFDTLLGTYGSCDTMLYLDLSVHNSFESYHYDTICAGDSLFFENQYISTSGIYNYTYQTVFGCDSVIQLNLFVKPSSNSTVIMSTCDSLVAPDGQVFYQTGVYQSILTNFIGCDSTVTIDLEVMNSSFISLQNIVCDSFIDPTGNIIVQSGNYNFLFINSVGCDSLVEVDLTINNTIHSFIQELACDSFISPLGLTLYQSGYYADTLISSYSCDSIINYDLIINKSTDTSLSAISCGDYIGPDSITYYQSGNYIFTLINCVGCDSIVELDLTVLPEYEVLLLDTICEGDSLEFIDTLLSDAGIYHKHLLTQYGCDSIVTLDLSIDNPVTIVFNNSFPDTFLSSDSALYLQTIISPQGGVFSGNGVISDSLYPSIVGQGWNSIYYTYLSFVGCIYSDSILFFVEDYSGLGSIDQSPFMKIYPNPAQQTIIVSITRNSKNMNYKFEVIDQKSNIISHVVITDIKTEIDVSDLSSGLYFLRLLKDDKFIVSSSFIVIR